MTDVLNIVGRSPNIARGLQGVNIHVNGRRRRDAIDAGAFWEGTGEDVDIWERGLSEYMFDRASRRSIAARAELITIVDLPEIRK